MIKFKVCFNNNTSEFFVRVETELGFKTAEECAWFTRTHEIKYFSTYLKAQKWATKKGLVE